MSKKQKVYILHGWSVSSENKQKWQTFISAVEKNNVECIFLGIPGLSSPLNEVWNLDNFVEWLLTQIPVNEKVVLLGHSFGGQISIRFTAKYPEKVQALILLDSAGIRDHSLVPTVKRKVFWLMAKIGKLLLPFKIFRTILYKLAREKDYINSPPLLKRTMSTILDQEVIEDLPKISCKTSIIWGAEDTVTPTKLSYIFRDNIKNSQLTFIEGARHSPQFTHVKETAQVVDNFLRNSL